MATFTTAAAAAMLSTNNEERRAAEAVYRQALNASAEAVVQVLVQSLMNRELETSVRMISAVLLRQLLDHTKKTWQHVSPQVGSMRMGSCHGEVISRLLNDFCLPFFTFYADSCSDSCGSFTASIFGT
jgi:hypothetical protein